MLGCQSSSLNAVFGREVGIQMLKMAVLDRQEGVEKKKPPSTRRTAADGGKGHQGRLASPLNPKLAQYYCPVNNIIIIEKTGQNLTWYPALKWKSVIKNEFHELTHNLGKTLN